MRKSLRDPDAVEAVLWLATVRLEIMKHRFRIQLEKAHATWRKWYDIRGADPFGGRTFGQGQSLCNLDLLTTDRNPGHVATLLFRKVSGGSTNATAYVEDIARLGQSGQLKEIFDEVNLSFLFTFIGRLEIPMMDVLSPVNGQSLVSAD
jgi:hypothetical protein